MTATLEPRGMDDAAVVWADLRDIITSAIKYAPRSRQTRIGPSEVGHPCSRRLIHKLMGTPYRDDGSKWLATIGTAVHLWLEKAVARSPLQVGEEPRFLLEQRVTVGEIDGQPITGSADVFDQDAGCVVDWKCVGPTRLAGYKRNRHPGDQYRVQAHLYARGFALQGRPVHNVMIVFLPRNGELNTAYIWAEPYDESVAIAALTRATELVQLARTIGAATAAALYPPCADDFCPWCPDRPRFQALTPETTPTVAELFASAR